MRELCQSAIIIVVWLLVPGSVCAEDQRKTSVGMPARIEQIVLAGPELEVRPLDRVEPIVLRIVETYPHGTAFRYDLLYYGLEPGEFDLKKYLRRKDGSAAADLPAIRVTIEPMLPAGQILPYELEPAASPALGGYRTILVAFAVVWVGGMIALIFLGRRRPQTSVGAEDRQLTLADRLQPLVEEAMAGTLTPERRADLERVLLAYWKKRLNLGDMKPGDALALLRQHAEAGPLLEQLEIWLHRPPASPIPGDERTVDVAALLRRYREIDGARI